MRSAPDSQLLASRSQSPRETDRCWLWRHGKRRIGTLTHCSTAPRVVTICYLHETRALPWKLFPRIYPNGTLSRHPYLFLPATPFPQRLNSSLVTEMADDFYQFWTPLEVLQICFKNELMMTIAESRFPSILVSESSAFPVVVVDCAAHN
ncbi:hypothetical protein BJY00DRAFT_187695 [Aspergillus carlsbadensis]|nr:hypothetical protein BJY00DRAFT_187695 [Aspergillus carlsbadensis]